MSYCYNATRFDREKGYFQDPVNGNVAKQVPLVAAPEAAPESNDLTWTEYTVPFVYASEADPYYALVSFATSNVASLHFVKIEDIRTELQATAKKALAKLGGFQKEGGAQLIVSAASLLLDNTYDNAIIVKEYNFGEGSTLTSIEDALCTDGVAPIYDLQGRRIGSAAQRGVVLQDGKKTVR